MTDQTVRTTTPTEELRLASSSRQKHPKHAAEVRENVITCRAIIIFVLVSPNQRNEIDSRPRFATLFLHEDLLARTPASEPEPQKRRCAEMEVGRGDPGRPWVDLCMKTFSKRVTIAWFIQYTSTFIICWCHSAVLRMRTPLTFSRCRRDGCQGLGMSYHC